MDSDIHNHHRIYNHHHNQQQQQQQQNMNSGLTRYRSAPSSYFSNIINSGMYADEDLDPFYDPRISSPESERILPRFMSAGDGDVGGNNLSSHQNTNQISRNEFIGSMEQMMYQNHSQSQEVVHNNKSIISSSGDPLRAMDPQTNLLRQSSSPAGFYDQINVHKGYSMMISKDKFQASNGIVLDSSFSSASTSSSRILSHIPNNGGYVAWDKSSMLTDGFLNEFARNDRRSSSENQDKLNDEGRIQSIHAPTGLTHQLSLPTEFQENVPLRSRAKRGCATHPRSIAERVRRTRISERMRKLQDLVPNMDKQTSTADMLDLAVDYIKELQILVETLSERQSRCTCHNKLKP